MFFEKNPKAKIFYELHHQKKPFMLANAWDAASARIFEKAGFSAIGTTSAGIAASKGYQDGQNIPLEEVLDTVEQILSAVEVPVSVDIEAGFCKNNEELVRNIKRIVSLGAVGINLEDGTGCMTSPLTPIDQQVAKIRAIREEIPTDRLWINARMDAIYLGLLEKEAALEETIRRAHAYLEAGVNSIFVFGAVNDKESIARLIREIKAPLNLLANPGLPSIKELEKLGVARVSLGSGAMRATLGLLEEISQELLKFGTYRSLTKNAVSYPALQELFIKKRKVICQN
jgi:2-methylisocitrate lyase-like PEP mutase family enzyme